MTTANYSSGNDRFDAEAAAWDTQPEVVETSARCLSSLLSSPLLSLPSSTVLEIGCGTGLLTVPLSSHVSRIYAVDTAPGMISMLTSKPAPKANITARVKLLDHPNDPVLDGHQFDLVLSHLVFHHIPDMQRMVDVMMGCCKPSGRIWISDFEDDGPQAEAFHPKHKVSTATRRRLRSSKGSRLTQNRGRCLCTSTPASNDTASNVPRCNKSSTRLALLTSRCSTASSSLKR